MPQLRPTLCQVLLNENLIAEATLIRALHYQFKQPSQRYLSLAQILIAFNDLHVRTLQKLRTEYPQLDEDPILQILLEEGYLSQDHYDETLYRWQQLEVKVYPGLLLERFGYLPLAGVEDALAHYAPLTYRPPQAEACISPEQLLARRRQQTALIKSQLVQQELFNTQELAYLLPKHNYLPLPCKPLGELLVLRGALLSTELTEALAETCTPENEPLIAILVNSGVLQEWQIAHVLCMNSYSGETPRLLSHILVESGYCEAQAIEGAILNCFQRMLPELIGSQSEMELVA
jgi:hypothetical protein